MVLLCENWCFHSLVYHFQLWNTCEYTVRDCIWPKTNTIKSSNACKIFFCVLHFCACDHLTRYFTEPTTYSMSDNIKYIRVLVKSGENMDIYQISYHKKISNLGREAMSPK